jgi:hypothetical protein
MKGHSWAGKITTRLSGPSHVPEEERTRATPKPDQILSLRFPALTPGLTPNLPSEVARGQPGCLVPLAPLNNSHSQGSRSYDVLAGEGDTNLVCP